MDEHPTPAGAAAGPWRIGRGRALELRGPCVMAILNVTPDSFSDGGGLLTLDDVVRRGREALDQGAAILDVGGESTRPGSVSVESDEQRRRVVPAVEALVDALPGVVVSVDTTRADVARAALRAGAVIVNDVSAGTDDPAMLPMLAGCDAGCVLMHRVTSPHADRYSDRYSEPPMAGDAVTAVRGWLAERVEAAGRAGIDPGRVVIDPGLGFGKTVEQNLALIRRTGELLSIGRPVLSGLSRKSFVGRASLARESQPLERSAGTLALTVMHRLAGASIFRVHDAGPHVQALRAVDACREAD